MTTSLPASPNNVIVAESTWATLGVFPGMDHPINCGLSPPGPRNILERSVSSHSGVPGIYDQHVGRPRSASSIMASFSLASNGTAGVTYDNAADGGNNGASTASLTYPYTVEAVPTGCSLST